MKGHATAPSITAGQAAPGPFVQPVRSRGRVVRVSIFILESLWVLPLGCAAGFVWANLWGVSYFRVTEPVGFWVNDVAIAIFFAVVAKEVVEAALPGGALHPWRRAALPAVAAVGSVAATVALYLLILSVVAEPMLRADGWAVPCGVDIAMCYLVGALIFGRHAAIPYLLLLAIASNVMGFALIGIFHPIDGKHWVIGAAMLTGAMAGAYGLRRSGVRSFWAYLSGPGTLSWFALYLGGVHPAMALVPIVPFMPHARHDDGLFVEPSASAHDTLSEMQRWWDKPIQVILFLFGAVNAGVPVHGLEVGMWALPAAMILGRPIGAVLGAGAGVAFGLHPTVDVGWRETAVIGCAASVGLTLALYFSTAVLPIGPLLMQLRVGSLLSVAGIAAAFAMAHRLRVGRFAPKAPS